MPVTAYSVSAGTGTVTPGFVLKQPDLAGTLEALAAEGPGLLYGGALGEKLVARLAELATNRQTGLGDEDAHARRKNILAGVRNLLAAVALLQPLVLVVEGMHWADKASLDVLSDVVHASDPLPIFVLLVTRPDDRSLYVLDGVMRTELRGLSTDEQVRLVQTRLGVRDGARRICGDLLSRVGGNPFFLLEMVDALLERGALEIREIDGPGGEAIAVLARTDRADADFDALPSTLEQLLGDRLRELPPEERAGRVDEASEHAGHDDDEAFVHDDDHTVVSDRRAGQAGLQPRRGARHQDAERSRVVHGREVEDHEWRVEPDA